VVARHCFKTPSIIVMMHVPTHYCSYGVTVSFVSAKRSIATAPDGRHRPFPVGTLGQQTVKAYSMSSLASRRLSAGCLGWTAGTDLMAQLRRSLRAISTFDSHCAAKQDLSATAVRCSGKHVFTTLVSSVVLSSGSTDQLEMTRSAAFKAI